MSYRTSTFQIEREPPPVVPSPIDLSHFDRPSIAKIASTFDSTLYAVWALVLNIRFEVHGPDTRIRLDRAAIIDFGPGRFSLHVGFFVNGPTVLRSHRCDPFNWARWNESFAAFGPSVQSFRKSLQCLLYSKTRTGSPPTSVISVFTGT